MIDQLQPITSHSIVSLDLVEILTIIAIVSSIAIALFRIMSSKQDKIEEEKYREAHNKEHEELNRSIDKFNFRMDTKVDDVKLDIKNLSVDMGKLRASLHELRNTIAASSLNNQLLAALWEKIKDKDN